MARKRKTGGDAPQPTGAADGADYIEAEPILPWPETGGSYLRDPATGELTPNPAEAPAQPSED